MINNIPYFLKFSFRVLFKRNLAITLINIGGLAVGFASVLLTYLYTYDELTYDRFHPNYERVHRIVVNWNGDGVIRDWARSSPPIGALIRDYMPEVEEVVRVRKNPGTDLLTVGQVPFYEPNLLIVESGFFNLFGFRLKEGSPESVLADKYSIVLTENIATKYFGDENPIGQVILYDNTYELTVTGIAENPPTNSHLNFGCLISFELLDEMFSERRRTHWGQFDHYTYARLAPDVDLAEVNVKLKSFLVDNAPPWVPEKMYLSLQQVHSIHLESDRKSELSPNSDVKYPMMFITAAILILIVAMVNYVNLSVAIYLRRKKEITMRKIMGSSKRMMITNFLAESLIICLLSMGLALVIIWILLPEISYETGKDLMPQDAFVFIISALLFSSLIALLAGVVPSLHLVSSLNVVLQTKLVQQRKLVRNLMIAIQIAISTGLITGMLVVTEQLSFLYNASLGFDVRNVLVIPVKDRSNNDKYPTTTNRLSEIPGIQTASYSSSTPGSNTTLTYTYTFKGAGRGETPMSVVIMDEHFIDLYNIKLHTGRLPSGNIEKDQAEIVINQSAVELLGLDNPIGTAVTGKIKGTVVGVVEDFQTSSLHASMEPVIMYNYLPTLRFVSVKLDGKYTDKTISDLSETWSSIYPNYPLEYTFLSEENRSLYSFENGVRLSLNYLVPIAIFVAVIGLLGYTMLLGEEKAHEFSIMKVLGGSQTDILKHSLRRVIIVSIASGLVISGLSYMLIEQWQANFAYHQDPDLWVLLLPPAAMVSLIVMIMSILLSLQLKQSPLKYLRQN